MGIDTRSRWINWNAALACTLLSAPIIYTVRADACPSIDAWLELVREKGGQHWILDATELSRFRDMLGPEADDEHHSWTSAIMTMFPDGTGLVLLNVNTGVCGVIEVPLNRRPSLRQPITLHSG